MEWALGSEVVDRGRPELRSAGPGLGAVCLTVLWTGARALALGSGPSQASALIVLVC